MSFGALKSELSDLQAGKELRYENKVKSTNGLDYEDMRPLKLCKEYGMLVKPDLKCCQHCDYGLEVLELTEEKREMFLDTESGIVSETGDEESLPVTAFLTIATVRHENEIVQKIVYKRFEGMTDCPRRGNCKP